MNLRCPVHLCLVGWVSQVLPEKSKSSIVRVDQHHTDLKWLIWLESISSHSQRVLLTAHPVQTCLLYMLRLPNYRQSPKMCKWRKKISGIRGEAGTQSSVVKVLVR